MVYYRDVAKLYKEKISVPVILVGGIRSYELAKELVEKELADYISLCVLYQQKKERVCIV